MEWRRTGLRLALDAVLAWVCVATQWTFSRMYIHGNIPQAVVPLVLFPGVTAGLNECVRAATTRKQSAASLTILLAWVLFINAFTHAALHGTMWSTECEGESAAVKHVLLTTQGAVGRRDTFRRVAERLGVEYTEHVSAPPPRDSTDKDAKVLALLVEVRAVLQSFQNETGPYDWIALYEDDARLFDWFKVYLKRGLCVYADYDLIWLNPLSSVSWFFLRQVAELSTGMVYRRDSISRIAAVLDVDDAFMQARFASPILQGEDVISICHVLESACNTGILRCAAVPLVLEWGFPSTLGGSHRVAHHTGPGIFD
jgi:hypothetical protein